MDVIMNKFKWIVILTALFNGCTRSVQVIEPEIKVVYETYDARVLNHYVILEIHNKIRKKHGLNELEPAMDLIKFAQTHAEWMADRDRLKHQNINPLMENYRTAGENIACGQRDEEEVMNGWMNSPGHRANILNKSYKYIGIGISVKDDGMPYYCVNFAG